MTATTGQLPTLNVLILVENLLLPGMMQNLSACNTIAAGIPPQSCSLLVSEAERKGTYLY